MNRRNFLKLFGIIAAVPTSAHALRGIHTPPPFQQMRVRKKKREINLYVTLENRFNETHGKHRVMKAIKRADGRYHILNYGEWSDTFLVHGVCAEEDMMIIVETQNGTSVSFTPTANPYQEGKFEAVNITTVYSHSGVLPTYKLKATEIRNEK